MFGEKLHLAKVSRQLHFQSAREMRLHECLGGSSARCRSLGNEIPERPDNKKKKKKTNGEPINTESIHETSIR